MAWTRDINQVGHVRHSGFKDRFLTGFNKQRQENSFCDVTIIVDGERFPAHKAVLALMSDYFKAMFGSNFVEAASSEVAIEGRFKSEVFRKLLDFAYTGELYVKPDDIVDLIELACYLQFPGALQMCSAGVMRLCQYWNRIKDVQLGVQVVFQVAVLAQNYGLELQRQVTECSDFLTTNFVKFAETEMFLRDVSPEYLEHFLDRNDLTGLSDDMCEEQVLKAVTNWLKHDWSNRKVHTERLLNKIRLGAIPGSQLTTYITEEMRAEPGCRTLLNRILQGPGAVSNSGSQGMFARRGVTVLIGIVPTTNKHLTFYYNDATRQWTEQGFPNITGTGCNTITHYGMSVTYSHDIPVNVNSVNGQLYVGIRKNENLKNFLWFNDVTKRWKQLPPIKRPFTGRCAVVHLHDYLYTIGGSAIEQGASYSEVRYGCEVMRFSVVSQSWEILPPIPSPKATSVLSPVAVSFMGKLLVSIATTENERGMFMFNPASMSWRDLQLRVSEQDEPRFVEEEGKLYLIQFDKTGRNKAPVVHQLLCDLHSAELGESEDQTLTLGIRPGHKLYPAVFKIKNKIFVNLNGYVHKTGIIEQPNMDDQQSEMFKEELFSICKVVLLPSGIQEPDKLPVFGKHTFEKVKLTMNLPRK